MTSKKIRVALLFGGNSAEHEVSIQSAKNVYTSIDKNKYDVQVIGIDKKGQWYLSSGKELLDLQPSYNQRKNDPVSLVVKGKESNLMSTDTHQDIGTVDVVFPVLHGPYGEDGSMQGFLKIMNVPCVGSGVLGSAIGMDKDVSKRLLRDADLPVADFLTYTDKHEIDFDTVVQQLGLPFFVKPANLGSSIGVAKVKNKEAFTKAVESAFSYDTKILIEQYIAGVEIECSVLGNEQPIASIAGQIVANHEFYDYEAKYLDEHGAVLKIPAELSDAQVKAVQDLAIKTFKTLCLEGMARVDFFLSNDGKFYVNEVNTIPGFTNISMYPKLWEASGISYTELIDKLITLAIEKYEKQSKLKSSV